MVCVRGGKKQSRKIMLIILSPAKAMDMSPLGDHYPSSVNRYEEEARLLSGKLSLYRPQELSAWFRISPALAEMNYERYQEMVHGDPPAKQALFAYNGSVFREIAPLTLSDEALDFAQERLRIISPLYGITRPLDMIRAYRLAFPLKIAGMEGTLYDFWRENLTQEIVREAGASDGVLLNLASQEVAGVFDRVVLNRSLRMVTVVFKEYRGGKYTTIRSYVKKARGAITRYILTHSIDRPEPLRNFRWDRYRFDERLSDPANYIFTRK